MHRIRGPEEEAEFLFCFFRRKADGLKDALLDVGLVDTEGAAAEFDAVEDQVIGLGIDVSRVGFQFVQVFVAAWP